MVKWIWIAFALFFCTGVLWWRARVAPHQMPPVQVRVELALERGRRYLETQRGPDGAWHSAVYGAMRDGLPLTPHVALGLQAAGGSASTSQAAAYLSQILDDADGLRRSLIDPVYTAAQATQVLQRQRGNADRWIKLLRSYQFSSQGGWAESDGAFGGWGYAVLPPQKNIPDAGAATGSNISATVFALEACRAAGVEDAALYRQARQFIERCQNFSPAGQGDGRFDDGGFFFSPTDLPKNKAGPSGTDRLGRSRFTSYGTATADGVRALLLCGAAADDPRVLAGRHWLETHFTPDQQPGDFGSERAAERMAHYYYWSCTVAKTCQMLRLPTVQVEGRQIDWAPALAAPVLSRQRGDGSWRNVFSTACEDDPLVATPFALQALAVCRAALAGAAE